MYLDLIKGAHKDIVPQNQYLTGRETNQEFSGDIRCPLRALGKMEHSVGMLKSRNPTYVVNGVE